MNLGELKLNPSFFNSQVQLNNDWFVSKKNETSSFENILANKTKERSEVKREFEPKVKAKFDDNREVERPKTEQKLDDNEEINALKRKINEVIARKKFEKESISADGEKVSLDDLKDKIESLEAAIKKELGISEEMGITAEPDVLELIAQMLNVDLEVLVQQLSTGMDEETKEGLIELISTEIEAGTIEPKELIKELKQVFAKLEKENRVELEKVVSDLIEKLPEGEAKVELVKFEAVLENVIKNQVPEEEVKVTPVSTDAEAVKEVKPATEQVVSTEKNELEKPVVQAKSSSQQEETSEKQSEPLVNVTAKSTQKESTQKFSIDDQVNLMKAESSTIVSTKETPKTALSRSVMNQVIQGTKMSINLSDQGSEILVKLNPKNLGNVSLKMAFDKGTLLAQIQVENQTVKSIIESNLADLKNALKGEGYVIGELDVSVNKENTGEQEQQSFSQSKRQQVKLETFEEIEEKIAKQNLVGEKAIDYLA
ncbi:MAG: flagellar hook-length control protein FliK [Clostridiales bacterium]|nr:flagellar hook-length control protein FliK [Clostridiales bacterium]